MSFVASTGKIEIKDSLGNIKFTTDKRLMQVHSTVEMTYQLPFISATSAYTPYNVTYTISDAFNYNAEFIIGYALFGGHKFSANGAIILELGFVNPGVPAIADSAAFSVSGKNIIVHRTGFRAYGVSVVAKTINFVFYVGNYDL